jgi:hypothetical protein
MDHRGDATTDDGRKCGGQPAAGVHGCRIVYPPGEESLPLHIFQIIGYPSPSSRLAALCAVDLTLAIGLLALIRNLGRGDRA